MLEAEISELDNMGFDETLLGNDDETAWHIIDAKSYKDTIAVANVKKVKYLKYLCLLEAKWDQKRELFAELPYLGQY
jgi:hypothetical protein